MDIQFKIGILVGLVVAWLLIRLTRSNARKDQQQITQPMRRVSKYYVDDTTKAYIAIAVGIIILIVITFI